MKFFTKLTLMLTLSLTHALADVSESEKLSILAEYFMKEKSASPQEARSQALASIYGKVSFEDLVYDSSSEMFFGRVISEYGDFAKDVSFYMPRKRALSFEKELSAGNIKIEHAFDDNEIVIKDIEIEYEGINYPMHTEVTNNFSLKLGGYFTADQNTEVALKKHGLGQTLNLQDLFGLDKQTTTSRVEANYRFSPNHQVELSWFKIDNSSQREVDKSFEYNGEVIDIGAALDIYFNTQIIKLVYGYSAYHTTKLDLTFRAGLHVTSIATGLSAQFNTNSIDKSVTSESISITAPLPIFGFGMKYEIVPSLDINYQVDYFFLSYDSTVTGSFVDTTLALEYMYNRYIGAGFGVNASKLRLGLTKENTKFETRQEVAGAIGYLIFSY